MFEAAMEHFARGLALLSEQDISAVPPRQLGADIQQIRGFINRAEAQCVRRVEVFDREQAYGSSGDTSTTNWLRHHCQLSGFVADKHVKLARQLAELLSAARTKDPAEVRQAAREIRHRVDAAGMARQAMEQFRKRRLHLYDLPDGMVGVEGALPPEGGAALRLTLESLTGVPPKNDERTAQQRRADALIELCWRQLDSGTLPSLNGRKPHLTVVVQAETLAGAPGAPAARLEGAGPISGETARRLLCGGSASVLRVDGKGVALDLGRAKRLASEAQRRVLAARDRGCVVPGCSWEARFCEPHHLDQWALGGGTRVARMVLLCKVAHHPLVHEGGWKLAANADGTFALVPPWEQPRAGCEFSWIVRSPR